MRDRDSRILFILIWTMGKKVSLWNISFFQIYEGIGEGQKRIEKKKTKDRTSKWGKIVQIGKEKKMVERKEKKSSGDFDGNFCGEEWEGASVRTCSHSSTYAAVLSKCLFPKSRKKTNRNWHDTSQSGLISFVFNQAFGLIFLYSEALMSRDQQISSVIGGF